MSVDNLAKDDTLAGLLKELLAEAFVRGAQRDGVLANANPYHDYLGRFTTGPRLAADKGVGESGDKYPPPPKRISAQEADEILREGKTIEDKNGSSITLGAALLRRLNKHPEKIKIERKRLLPFAIDTIETGEISQTERDGNKRDLYIKIYASKKHFSGGTFYRP
ncbi:MAG: hypothetical protein ACK5LK_05760 [Chthoniobacterales bacterium]